VASLHRHTTLHDVDVLVVDNSDSEEEFFQLATSLNYNFNGFTGLDIKKTPSNLGLAGGINFGLKHIRNNETTSDFLVWILNPDTKIDNDSLNELIELFNPSIHSIVGSIVKDYSGDRIIASHGEFKPKLGHTITRADNIIGSRYFYPVGASLFTSNSVLINLGDFDEQYFLYFEELDFTLKGLKVNLKPAIAEKSFVYHAQGVTTKNKARGKKNLAMLRFQASGLKKLYAKHFPKLGFGLRLGLLSKAMTLAIKGEFKGALIFLNEL